MAFNGMTSRISLVVLVLPAAIMLACGKETSPGGFASVLPRERDLRCDIPFTDLAGSAFILIPGGLPSGIIDTPEEFCRIWDSSFTTQPCDPGRIDFDHEIVLVASLWSLQTSGIDLRVECVQSDDSAGAVEVLLAVQLPGNGCLYPDWIVNPLAMVKVPRPVESATFEVLRTFKIDCN